MLSERLSRSMVVVGSVFLISAGAADAGDNLSPGKLLVAGNFVAAAEAADKPHANIEKPEKEETPEQKMNARFPQPVKVGHLIGLPVLDDKDRTIGYVKQVVQTPEGKIKLIVPYASWLGWVRDDRWWTPSRREIGVPIEAVAILALQIDSIDMDRKSFDAAPTWVEGQAVSLPADGSIKIALARR